MPPLEASLIPPSNDPDTADQPPEPSHEASMSDQGSAEQPKTESSGATSAEAEKPHTLPAESVDHPGSSHDGPSLAESKETGAPSASGDLIDFADDSRKEPADNVHVEPTRSKGKEVATSVETAIGAAPEAPADMESSVATLKPTRPQHLTLQPIPYVDPTPATPSGSQPPSRTASAHRSRNSGAGVSPTRSDAEYDERRYTSEDEQEGASQSEIQSIMEQFPEDGTGPGEQEVMSPRLELASPLLGGPSLQHPPRKSSLEPLAPSIAQQIQDFQERMDTRGQHVAQQIQDFQGLRLGNPSPKSLRSPGLGDKDHDDQGPPVPPKDVNPGQTADDRLQGGESATTSSPTPLHRPPPPEPEPEPALPFDFHRFLDQLKNKKADPVARYLKSFLSEFGKRQWMVHEQVKIISDFLAFIANKMAQCEVWSEVSDAEFDNAREGMEKLVMNRLYTQTFSPAIAPPQPIPGAKPKRRGGDRPMGPGRRGQHQEDVERDDILAQKIKIYSWVREGHLDIPPVGESGKRFLTLAQNELLKIKTYRAPRDKIICVLNCCKVIFGLLKHTKSDSSADSFMPLLIYTVLQANPDHLVSNVQYILRFRNQEKLGGEAGYYLSSLMGVVQFVENMDRTTLTITDEEFEKNVEAAVRAIAEKHPVEQSSPRPSQPQQLSEKTGLHPPGESSTRPSLDIDAVGGTPRRSLSSNDDMDDGTGIPSLLRSIQRPLSTIGRMFSDEPTTPPAGSSSPSRQPQGNPSSSQLSPGLPSEQRPQPRLSAEEAAARQASAEAAEAQKLQRAEHNNVVETLASMFPDLDREIISDVVYQKQGRVGLAVDACLALST